MTASILIELPFPAKILWPNGRGHYMAKHREFQKHRTWAHNAVRAITPPYLTWNGDRIQWSVTIHPKTRNVIDRDNAIAAMKAYADGISVALGIDDRYFDTPALHFAEPAKPGKVVISIGAPTHLQAWNAGA